MIDLSSLATVVSDQNNDSEIDISSGGTLLDPLLTTLSRTDLIRRRLTDSCHRQITSITGGIITTNGGTLDFSGLTTLDAANLSATAVANCLFHPGETALFQRSASAAPDHPGQWHEPRPGPPSEIDLSHVTTSPARATMATFFNAYPGGEIDLSHLASNPSGRNYFQVSDAGSVIDLSSLSTVVSDQDNDSEINIGAGGTLLDPL